MSAKWLLSLLIFACSHLLVAAHYGTPDECEFLEKVERLRSKGENDQALDECNRKLQQLSNHTGTAFYLKVAHEKAGVLFALGDFEAARDFLRPIKNLTSVDVEDYKAAWGDCMYALGKAYHFVDELDSAIYFFKLALNARLDLQYPNHEKLADNHTYLGYTFRFDLLDYQQGEKYFLRVGEHLSKFNATNSMWGRHYLNLAACMSSSDYEKALNYNFKALYYYNQATEGTGTAKRSCLGNIANIYGRREDHKNAIMYYRLSLKEAMREARFRDYQVLAYENLGLVYRDMGVLDSASFYISKALELNKELYGENSKEVAESLYLLSISISDKRRAQKLRAEAINRKLHFYYEKGEEMSLTYQMVATWFKRNNENDSALYYYQKSMMEPSAEFLKTPTIDLEFGANSKLAYNLAGKAEVLKKIGKTNKSSEFIASAISHYKLYSEVYNRLLWSRESEAEKLDFVNSSKEFYDQAVEASYLLYEISGTGLADIWFFIERSKSAVLMHQAQEARAEIEKSADLKLISEKRKLQGELKQLSELSRQPRSNLDSIRNELFNLNIAIDSVEMLMGVMRDPKDINKDIITYQDVLKSDFIGNGGCLLQTYTADSMVYIFTATKSGVSISRLSHGDYDLIRSYVKNLKKVLSDGLVSVGRLKQFKEFIKSSAGLYETLLKKICEEKVSRVVVIPDGFLAGIPFEVLISTPPSDTEKVNYRDLLYIIKKKEIAYGYSASWYFSSSRFREYSDESSGKMLAFAYSKANDQTPKSQFEALPGSELEIKAIKAAWGEGFNSFAGSQATEANFKSSVSGHECIHIATHNYVDEGNSLNSGLVFRTSGVEDGILHLYEIYQLVSNAKLVVLSACESGLGDYYTGEGYLSAGRAFAQQGTALVISSLWKTSDNHSRSLMTNFYSKIATGYKASRALHQSKLDFIYLNDEYGAHPSNWGSYLMFGNGNNTFAASTNKSDGTAIWMVITLLFFMLIIMLIWYLRGKYLA